MELTFDQVKQASRHAYRDDLTNHYMLWYDPDDSSLWLPRVPAHIPRSESTATGFPLWATPRAMVGTTRSSRVTASSAARLAAAHKGACMRRMLVLLIVMTASLVVGCGSGATVHPTPSATNSAPSPTPTVGTVTYTSPLGFSFRYNAAKYFLDTNWRASPFAVPVAGGMEVGLVQREEPDAITEVTAVTVAMIRKERPAYMKALPATVWLRGAIGGFEDQMRARTPGIKFLLAGLCKLGGQPGFAIEARATVDGVVRRWAYFQAYGPKAAYIIICAAPQSDWSSRAPDFALIGDSFRCTR